MNKERGFTLIELLVVIAIIGVLSSVIMAALGSARTRAFDAERKADLTQIRIALDYYYDAFSEYPITGPTWHGVAPPASPSSDWIPGLVSGGFMTELPQDPTYPSAAGGGCAAWPSMYLYISVDGTGYKLLAHCPVSSSVASTPATDAFYDPVRPTWAWQVCTGADCAY